MTTSTNAAPITGNDPEYPSSLPHDHAFCKGAVCVICTEARNRDLHQAAVDAARQPPVETDEERRAKTKADVDREASWTSFERAFKTSVSGAQMQCACGHVFYNLENGWSWSEAEIAHVESLRKDGRATALDYAVESVDFDGQEYAIDCECWYRKAINVCRYLKIFDRQIAQFLTLEKRRLELAARNAPVVE